METLSMLTILAPLTMTWGIFITSSNTMSSLVSLLAVSLILPLIFMEHFKMFWPCGILLILMSTGLIVVFAYIVSLHSKEIKSPTLVSWLSMNMIVFVSMLINHTTSVKKVFHPELGISVEVLPTFVLVFLLLFLVVSFIRNVYSKGGGFRKKY